MRLTVPPAAGDPGATKGLSTVIGMLQADFDFSSPSAKPSRVAYYYCTQSTGDRDYRSCEQILRSLLRQLSVPVDNCPVPHFIDEAFTLSQSSGFPSSTRGPDSELCLKYLCRLLEVRQYYTRVALVLEGFDECDEQTQISLVGFMKKLISTEGLCPIRILIQTRSEPLVEGVPTNGMLSPTSLHSKSL